jgi:hypothetical protein
MSLAGRIIIALLGIAGGLTAAAGALLWPSAVRADLQVGPAFFVFGVLPASLFIGALITADSRSLTTKESLTLTGGAMASSIAMLIGVEHEAVMAWASLIALVAITGSALRVRTKSHS